MVIDKFNTLINSYLGHIPTESQIQLIEGLGRDLFNRRDQIILITGYAGTGKTSVVAALVKTLKEFRLSTKLMAPTGRAAKVLSNYSGHQAYTIHKSIYRQKRSIDGIGEFDLGFNASRNTLFIVDEASMIANQALELTAFGSGRLLDDLLAFVFSGQNCLLMLIGDTAQLPPVGLDQSPALEMKYLSQFGFPVTHYRLTDVVRQSTESGVLLNATCLRERIASDRYGFPDLKTHNFPDVTAVQGDHLLDCLQSSYDTVGVEETLIVTRSNKTANRYNQGIRNRILWREEEIGQGDLVMVVKNNYFWLKDSPEIDLIANGDILEVMKIKGHKELYGFRFAEMTLRFTDYRQFEFDAFVVLDTLMAETASLDRVTMRNFYSEVTADYHHMKGKRHRQEAIMQDPFFNALQIKFAYALTCHKSQGGQWRHVYIDQGFIQESQLDREYYRWLYTAVTRATEKLYLVNFKEEYFQ